MTENYFYKRLKWNSKLSNIEVEIVGLKSIFVQTEFDRFKI